MMSPSSLTPGLQQRLHRVHVADQRALHVVNAQAVDHAVLHDGVRLVADAGQEVFVAGIRSVHVAVEHQALAVAAALQPADDVGARVFHLLPRDLQAQTAETRHACTRPSPAPRLWDWGY